jgi:hypothetical protein
MTTEATKKKRTRRKSRIGEIQNQGSGMGGPEVSNVESAPPAPEAPETPSPAATVKTAMPHEPCLCGCGQIPLMKKSRFMMGHDSRLRGSGPKPEPTSCLCGCGMYPKMAKSRYLPGHDSKHLSAILQGARARAEEDREEAEVEAAEAALEA